MFGEGFYLVDLEVNRLSGSGRCDTAYGSQNVWLMLQKIIRAVPVEAIGQFRSYNRHEGSETGWCFLYLSGRSISMEESLQIIRRRIRSFWTAISARLQSTGKLPLEGKLQISLLAVNRPYGKSDYIPCIAWGRNTRYGLISGWYSESASGEESRAEYTKKISESEM